MNIGQRMLDAKGVLELGEKRQLLAGIRLQFQGALAQHGHAVDPKTKQRAARWIELAAAIEEDLTRLDRTLRGIPAAKDYNPGAIA